MSCCISTEISGQTQKWSSTQLSCFQHFSMPQRPGRRTAATSRHWRNSTKQPVEHPRHLLGGPPHKPQCPSGGKDHQHLSHCHQEPAEVEWPCRQDAGLSTAKTNLWSAQRREVQSRRLEETIQRSSESQSEEVQHQREHVGDSS